MGSNLECVLFDLFFLRLKDGIMITALKFQFELRVGSSFSLATLLDRKC